jgi:hypothetical protein
MEWSASGPCHCKPRETASDTQSMGDWVGHTAGLNAAEKNLTSAGNRTPTVQPVTRCYTDRATLDKNFFNFNLLFHLVNVESQQYATFSISIKLGYYTYIQVLHLCYMHYSILCVCTV